ETLRADMACPPTITGYDGVRNTRPGLTSTLLPAEQPTLGLVCGYDLFTEGASVKERRLGAAEAEALASDIRALPLAHPAAGPHGCFAQGGRYLDVIVLRYAAGPDVRLWFDVADCPSTIGNGHIKADAGTLTDPTKRPADG